MSATTKNLRHHQIHITEQFPHRLYHPVYRICIVTSTPCQARLHLLVRVQQFKQRCSSNDRLSNVLDCEGWLQRTVRYGDFTVVDPNKDLSDALKSQN